MVVVLIAPWHKNGLRRTSLNCNEQKMCFQCRLANLVLQTVGQHRVFSYQLEEAGVEFELLA